MGKYLFKVSKITLGQRQNGRCSNVILLTLNRYLPTRNMNKHMVLILTVKIYLYPGNVLNIPISLPKYCHSNVGVLLKLLSKLSSNP